MGVVYKARHLQLDRVVALKMILAGGHAGAADLERFRVEAQAIARLQHPNIVQVFEVGEHEGLPFFSLEFCAGGTLAQQLAGMPLPPKDAAALVETLARAMHAAHEKGILHRDLKPANVLFSPLPSRGEGPGVRGLGQPKITDFGLAKKLDEAGKTATGAVMGTPSYMAPEQAGGKAKELGPACDVYSLGAILYECLTGRPPFRAATALDTIMQVVSDEPVPPRQLNAKLAADLETVCLKCLHKEPTRRYRTAAALAEDLRHFQAGEPIRARPVGSVERARKWINRHRALSALGVAVVLGAAAVLRAGAWALLGGGLDGALPIAAYAGGREDPGFAGHLDDDAGKESLRGKPASAGERVAGTGPRKVPSRRLGALEDYIQGSLFTLRGHTNQVTCVALTADGQVLASASGDKTIKLWDARTGQELRTLRDTNWVTSVAFAADGQVLASASWDTVKLWDARTGKVVRTLRGHTADVTSVAFAADGKVLASASRDKTVKLWDARTGQERHILRGHTSPVTSVAFTADGQVLASASGDKTVKLWDARTGQELHTLRGHADHVTSVAFAKGGEVLASASRDKTVKLWDAQTGQELRSLRGHTSPVTSVAFAADSQVLASANLDNTVKLWDARTGQELRTLRGHTSYVTSVAFAADGQVLASASRDQTVKLWDARTGQELRTLRGHTSGVAGVAFAADGQALASASNNQVKLWDARTGQELRILRGGRTPPVTSVGVAGHGQLRASAKWTTVELTDAQTLRVRTLRGHTLPVTSVAFAADGQVLASASGDKTVKLWDARTGQELRTLRGHAEKVTSVAFAADGQVLASASDDGTIKLWDPRTGQELRSLRGHMLAVTSVAFAGDGQVLASASSDTTIKLWDARTGQELRTLSGHSAALTCVAFAADGQMLASASQDGTVKLWDTRTGQEPEKERRFRLLVTAPDLHLHRDLAEQADQDKQPFALAFRLGRYLAVKSYYAANPEDEVKPPFSESTFPDGIACTGVLCKESGIAPARLLFGTARALKGDPSNWRNHAFHGGAHYRRGEPATALTALTRAAELHRKPSPLAHDFLALTYLALGQLDKAGEALTQARPAKDAPWEDLYVHRLLQPELMDACRKAVELHANNALAHHALGLALGDQQRLPEAVAAFRKAIAIDPTLAVAHVHLALALLVQQKRPVCHLNWFDEEQGFPANLTWTRFTPDGSAFLAGGDAGPKGYIRLWDVATGKQLQQFAPGGDPWFNGGLFLPDGKHLLTWYHRDSNLFLWDVVTGKLVRKFAGPGADPLSVAVAPDSKRCLAGGNDKVLRVYDLATGKELARLQGHGAKCYGVFSPDGKQVLSYGLDKTLRLWDADNGKLLHTLVGHTAGCTGVFSADGKQVLSYGPDKTLRLWDAATGKAVHSFAGPTDEVTGASFLPGGEKIVAWGKDWTVRVWEVGSGKALHPFQLVDRIGPAPTMALTPDGRRLLLAGANDTAVVIDLATGKEIQRFENAVGRQGFSFSPDGRYAAAGSFRAGVYLWRLPPITP